MLLRSGRTPADQEAHTREGSTDMQNQGKPTSGTQSSQTHGQGIYPVANHDYNIVAALAHELRGLEAIQKYMKDAQGPDTQVWQEALQLKEQLAELFTHELAEHAKEGHFGIGEKRSKQ